MIIHASVKSKGFKKSYKPKVGLSEMCGQLHLDASNEADVKLLTAMYLNCFGMLDKHQAGSIKVFDGDGKEVLSYWYESKPDSENKPASKPEPGIVS